MLPAVPSASACSSLGLCLNFISPKCSTAPVHRYKLIFSVSSKPRTTNDFYSSSSNNNSRHMQELQPWSRSRRLGLVTVITSRLGLTTVRLGSRLGLETASRSRLEKVSCTSVISTASASDSLPFAWWQDTELSARHTSHTFRHVSWCLEHQNSKCEITLPVYTLQVAASWVKKLESGRNLQFSDRQPQISDTRLRVLKISNVSLNSPRFKDFWSQYFFEWKFFDNLIFRRGNCSACPPTNTPLIKLTPVICLFPYSSFVLYRHRELRLGARTMSIM